MRYLLCVMVTAMVGIPAVAVEADGDADLQKTFSKWIPTMSHGSGTRAKRRLTDVTQKNWQ